MKVLFNTLFCSLYQDKEIKEIGFGHKIPKLNFVSHLKISQENCKKNFYDQTYQKKWKKVEKP